MLDIKRLHQGIDYLIERDTDLRFIIEQHGFPPLWNRAPGFLSLIKIILEQQVSLASAKATYDKLLKLVIPLNPKSFLSLDNDMLKKVGFSRQKIRYCRELSELLLSGQLILDELETLEDKEVINILTSVNGIGQWTANIYLLMVMGREDIWPIGDLALLKAIKEVKNLSILPNDQKALEISESWRPWRSVAARILWHYYLSS